MKSIWPRLLIPLCLAVAALAQDSKAENFAGLLREINEKRYDKALQNLFPIQKEIRIRLSGPFKPDSDLARRLREMSTPAAALSTIALLRAHFDSGDWAAAHDDATLVGFGLANLWARVPPYEKLEYVKADYAADPQPALLRKLGYAAIDAGDWPLAKTTATQILDLLAQKQIESDPGAYRHSALTIFGLAALHTGAMPAAEKYLLDSAKVEGGELMRRHGPNFRLALELFEKGRKASVAQFLTLCEQLNWEEAPVLKTWKEDVAAGRTPEFGAPNYVN